MIAPTMLHALIPASVTLDGPVPSVRPRAGHPSGLPTAGMILPGERKSVEPMAARVAPGDLQQLHHFVSTSPWAAAPLEDELAEAADRLAGGPDAVLVVDDTALVKQGRHSVGVKRQ